MCECVLIFFFLVILSATGFNIDQKNYAVFEPRDNNNSMFGFTVAMHKASGNRGWILVGAPEGQSIYQDASAVTKGGTVYKCQIDRDDVCQQIPFDRTSNVGFVGSALDEKSGQWFGATLSTSGRTDGPVVACAPRYVWFTKDLNRKDPVGTCFVSNGAFDSFEEYSPCRTMNWGYHRQGSCQAGFSAAINREGDRLYVGAPGSYYWQGQMYSIDAHAHFNYTPGFFGNRGYGAKGSVHQQSLENRPAVFSTREGKAPDDDSYIGYSTVVGHFKQGEEFEGIAVGMPRGNKLKGKVLLFTWNLNNYKNITISDQIGSYFGYSLTAADVNGDKKLDLVVGAPMHTEPNTENKYDVGRVYVFYQSSDSVESFNSSDFIDGTNSKGRFGHALASLGDLNQDGYDDFAVGAPYDGPQGRGAVYIFYGSKAGVRKKFGQVIYAEQVGGYLSTFGFSVAGGLDLDNNEYPDMAVGAYLSNSAFFFRARPVVFIDSSVRFLTPNKRIDLKQKNCRLPNGDGGTCTSIDFCIKYFGKGIPDQLSLNVEYLLDTKAKISRMRFKKLGTHTFNRTLVLRKDGVESCRTEEIYIKEDIRDKLTSLEAEVNFYMVDEDTFYQQLRNPLSQLRPVLDLNNPPSRKDSITIQNNCGVDNVCIPNLHLNVTSNIQEYLLGSNTTIEFTVIVSNFGQDSFETTFEMKYPATGIFYKKTVIKIPGVSCTETSNKTVLCDIGNPLPKDKIANFSIFFQPYHQGGFPNRSYVFDMLVNSSNPELPFTVEDNTKHIEIDIWIDATIDIKGQSYASLQPLSTYNNTIFKGSIKEATKETDIGPQITHVYYLTNKGPSQIQEAEVFLLWPLTTLSGDDLLYLLEQPITKGNIKCDLSPLVNYKKLKLEPQSTTIWDKLKIDISSFTSSTSSFQTSEKHEGGTIETGMGVGSGIGVVNQDQNKINTAVNTSGGDSSYITELRHNETTSSEHVRTWGTLNPNGQYEYTVSKYYTVMENGAPVTKWENTTTIRDANGRIISTLYHNDYEGSRTGGLNPLNYVVGLRQGEYEHKTARYFTTYDSAGNPTTRWQNKTVVTDLNGNVLRSYVWDESTGEYKLEAGGSDGYNREEQLRRQQQERIEEARRRKLEEERYEESRRQEERKRLEERKRIEEERIRLEEARRAEEKRKTDELRRQDEQRRRQEQQAREEEWRREQEKRRLEEIRRQGGTNRYDEERRREEERARQEEWSRQQARIAEERRRQDQIRMNEERRRQEQARYEERLKQQEQQRRINQQRHQQGSTEGDRRHYDQQTRQHSSQGGSSSSGNNVITGYFDQDGKYVARNPNELVFNKTYVFESSTTIPIDISGGKTFVGNGGNFNDLGSGFTVQTLDLGGGTKAGSQANGRESGGYNREWQAQGGYSTSGRIPPTFIHNNVQDQPLESTRFKRQIPNDPYADIKALVKCNSTKCIYIRCVVGALDRDQDVLIALRSRLNVRGLKDLAGSDEAIRLSSKMVSAITDLPYVEPIKKEKQVWKEYEIFTEVPAKEAELAQKVVPLWIYVVSAVAGVVMLLLLIWLLSKCGFFKRNRPSSGPERQPLNRNGYHSGDEAL